MCDITTENMFFKIQHDM